MLTSKIANEPLKSKKTYISILCVSVREGTMSTKFEKQSEVEKKGSAKKKKKKKKKKGKIYNLPLWRQKGQHFLSFKRSTQPFAPV